MCATCGCTPTTHTHDHTHGEHTHTHDFPSHPERSRGTAENAPTRDVNAHMHVVQTMDTRTIALERAILDKNAEQANRNRDWFATRGILALNLVSSPGSGKTTLLERTIRDLATTVPIVVIEGDQATDNDSTRIRAAGARAIQVNTGTGCHLEAGMIQRAIDALAPAPDSVVMVENVGNLVCPALFDLGEHAKVAILSVTEGDDKPAKYPHMFAAADLMIINKIDLLPYVTFDLDRCIATARTINPAIATIALSATTGEHTDEWYTWLTRQRTVVEDERARVAPIILLSLGSQSEP